VSEETKEVSLIERETTEGVLVTNIDELEVFVSTKLVEFTPENYKGDSDAAKKDRALLAEMDRPKDDVWKDAPVTATKALVAYYTNISGCIGQATCTRELPKSRARVIAEEARTRYERGAVAAGSLDDVIESAILKALAEKEAGK